MEWKTVSYSHCYFFRITYTHSLYTSNQLPVKRVRAKTFKYSLPKKITWFFLIWYLCVLLTLPLQTLGNISILPVHKIIIKAANGVYYYSLFVCLIVSSGVACFHSQNKTQDELVVFCVYYFKENLFLVVKKTVLGDKAIFSAEKATT